MPKVTGNSRNSAGKWIGTQTVDGTPYETQIHSAWSNMKGRCRKHTKHHTIHPTYNECSIVPEWEDFQVFADWYSSQVGFESRGDDGRVFQLDKDVLLVGNKLYGPDTCVLIPSQLNCFFIDCGGQRGEFPLGVSYHKTAGKYRSYIREDGKYVHLGLFHTAAAAEESYLYAKNNLLIKWIARLEEDNPTVDVRVVAALKQILH